LKQGISIEDVAGYHLTGSNLSKYRLSWRDLSLIPSPQHDNRRNYLLKNALEKYFPNDPAAIEDTYCAL